jgi:hypothetical protein
MYVRSRTDLSACSAHAATDADHGDMLVDWLAIYFH